VFAAYLHQMHHRAPEELRLGKKTEQLLAQAEKLHKQVNEYAYGPPTVRFTDAEVDQARAAGVMIELERSTPIITDRSLYRELCKQAIKRTAEELRARATELAEERKQARAAGRAVDPQAEARREHGRRVRQLAEQAHGANLDLGRALMNGLACVDPASMDDNLAADRYRVRTADSREKALAILSVEQFDVIVVDVNGKTLDLIDAIRTGDGLASRIDPDTPLIVLTSRADELHRIRALDRGGDDVLTKPFSYSELRARIAALLRRAEARRAPRVLRAGLEPRH
jgi:CheY-like chemotaxis protein